MTLSTRRKLRIIIGLLFVLAGSNHFIVPRPYFAMMPDCLPAKAALVQVSGLAEILGGLGVLLRATRKLAAWSLILFLVAVFPANLQVALHGWPGVRLPPWALWLRLPFQVAFIWGVYRLYLLPVHRERNAQE